VTASEATREGYSTLQDPVTVFRGGAQVKDSKTSEEIGGQKGNGWVNMLQVLWVINAHSNECILTCLK